MWLAPVQVTVIPIADRHLDYAQKLAADLKAEGVRTQVDSRSETVNQKIRQAQLDKTPYMLVVGDKEIAAGTISIRLRSGEQLPPQPFEQFKRNIVRAIAEKTMDLAAALSE